MTDSQSSTSNIPNLHPLEKLSLISHIILFASVTPKHVFSLRLVNQSWDECFVDFKYGKDILAKQISDPRSTHFPTFFTQAKALFKKEDVVCPELLKELANAIKAENRKSVTEFSAIRAQEVDDDDDDDDDDALFALSGDDYDDETGLLPFQLSDVVANPLVPAHRAAQQRAQATALTGIQYFESSPRNPVEVDDSDVSRQLCTCFFCTKHGFQTVLRYHPRFARGPPPPPITLSHPLLLPATLTCLYLTDGKDAVLLGIRDSFFDELAENCPLLKEMWFSNTKLGINNFSLKTLSGFKELLNCALHGCDLRCPGNLDLSELPEKLSWISLYENPKLGGPYFTGAAPKSLKRLMIDETMKLDEDALKMNDGVRIDNNK